MQPPIVAGTFALLGRPATTQAHLIAIPNQHHPLSEELQFWLNPIGSAQPITRYDIEMQKYAHVIVVSDDFSSFQHVHPTLLSDGRFILPQTFPHPGIYHIYADMVPSAMGQQVFRFDIAVDANNVQPVSANKRAQGPQSFIQSDGDYTVTLDKAKVQAGKISMVNIEVYQNGKPAEHLQPFLGVGAHAIILNTNDLTYDHTHPMHMSMSDMNMPMDQMMKHMPTIHPGDYIDPRMMIHLNLKEPGTYRMWIQFKDQQQKLHTVSYLITAVP